MRLSILAWHEIANQDWVVVCQAEREEVEEDNLGHTYSVG